MKKTELRVLAVGAAAGAIAYVLLSINMPADVSADISLMIACICTFSVAKYSVATAWVRMWRGLAYATGVACVIWIGAANLLWNEAFPYSMDTLQQLLVLYAGWLLAQTVVTIWAFARAESFRIAGMVDGFAVVAIAAHWGIVAYGIWQGLT
ncbi:MAG: hypothetical protein KF774_19605, partial [Planctomyces sp.]|nr:hypothetical protein [Planctomyces sp.]